MGTGPGCRGGQGCWSVEVDPRSEPMSSVASLVIPHTSGLNSSPYFKATEMQGKQTSPWAPFRLSVKAHVTSIYPRDLEDTSRRTQAPWSPGLSPRGPSSESE